MSEVKSGRGYVYAIQYHVVWCFKYRRKVLIGKVEEDLYVILKEISQYNDFTISEINGSARSNYLR